MSEGERVRRTPLERAVEAIQRLNVSELRELPVLLHDIDPWILARISGKED